jgi:hypothetical protein
VLDETFDRQSFIFDLVDLLHEKSEANFDFLFAARGYLSQAGQAEIPLLTLPELTKKLKDRFSDHSECFNISFFPVGDIPPFERIDEIIKMRDIELLIIPAPFTMFAQEEKPSETSLGRTVDQLISNVLISHNIPLFLARSVPDEKLPFLKIGLLMRDRTLRNDLLGWILALTRNDAQINLCYTPNLKQEGFDRVGLYHQALKDRIIEDQQLLTLTRSSEPRRLKLFCEQASKDSLIIFQGGKEIANEAEQIIHALCSQKSNVLLLPPPD